MSHVNLKHDVILYLGVRIMLFQTPDYNDDYDLTGALFMVKT